MRELFPEYPEIMSVEEACELLRCGRNSLYALLSSDNEGNRLRGYRNGRIWKIPKAAVEEYILEKTRLHRV